MARNPNRVARDLLRQAKESLKPRQDQPDQGDPKEEPAPRYPSDLIESSEPEPLEYQPSPSPPAPAPSAREDGAYPSFESAPPRRGRLARIVGATLLVLVGLFWLTLIPAMFDDPSETGSLILGGVILSVVPFGLGLYALRRSRSARRETPSHP